MKAFTLIIEFDRADYGEGDSGWLPGYFCGKFKNGYFRRVWWLCFAIAWVKMPLWEYNAHIGSGATIWRDK